MVNGYPNTCIIIKYERSGISAVVFQERVDWFQPQKVKSFTNNKSCSLTRMHALHVDPKIAQPNSAHCNLL